MPLTTAALLNRRRKDLRLAVPQRVSEVLELQSEAHVRFVRAEAVHRLVIGQLREGPLKLDTFELLEQYTDHPFDHLHHVFGLDEGHLQVELGEFRLPVRPQILVAKTFDDLEVAVEAADHQDLLEQLRRLRQGVELPGIDAARNQVVARAFGGALGEHRRLHVDKPQTVQIVPDQLGHAIAQYEGTRNSAAAVDPGSGT